MKPGILTQIMVTPNTGRMTLTDAFHVAKKLGYKMFAFNGQVYSVEACKQIIIKDTDGIKTASLDHAALFTLSDLVDYNYGA